MTPDALVDLARAAIRPYASLPGLRMALVTGSVARGLADASSDVDVHLSWDEVPRDRLLRERLAERAGARSLFAIPAAEGVFEKYRIHDGEQDRFLDVTSAPVTSLDRAALAFETAAPLPADVVAVAAGLRDARALLGDDDLERWRGRFAVTDRVAADLAQAHGSRLLSISALHDLTAARGDLLSYAARASTVLLHAVAALAAANRVLVPIDEPKWIPWQLGRLPVVPGRCASRIGAGVRRFDAEAAADLDLLVGEIVDLVEAHVPGFDPRPVRMALSLRPGR